MVSGHDINDCDLQGYITTLCLADDKSLPSLCTFANDVRSVPMLLAPIVQCTSRVRVAHFLFLHSPEKAN